MKIKNRISKGFLALKNVNSKSLAASIYTLAFMGMPVLASAESAGSKGPKWPWTQFLDSLQHELTGELATSLGILAIVFACIGLLSGHAGEGMKKILIILLAIGILIFAPTLVNMIRGSATGTANT